MKNSKPLVDVVEAAVQRDRIARGRGVQPAAGLAGRRGALRTIVGAGLLPFFVPILGCGDSTDDVTSGADGSGASGSGGTGGGGTGGATSSSTGGTPGSWASGGTAAMTDKNTYPDPFTTAVSSCVLVASTTEGPCTTATDLDREDISEGWSGLPVRLGLKVVDTSCNPLVGLTVRVWHTNIEGSYSGQTPNNGMCLKDQGYSAEDFFRGVQTTDADGEVFFDSCFPGWYSGRAVHIHFQVKSGNTTTRVSQLFFPEDVTEDIFDTHEEYAPYGQPNTVFASDNIIGGIAAADQENLILTVARMTDGAMLASKVVTVA